MPRQQALVSPPVQFVTTSDGVRIAYSSIGEGRPVLYMAPLPLRHVELEWRLPEDRFWLERLAHGRRLIRYDPRGLGLSQRDVASVRLDALGLDLAAVAGAAGDSPLTLLACLNAAPLAIRYAASHPARVSHLILWCPVARVADSIPAQLEVLLDVAARDWTLFTEAVAHAMVGWGKGESAHRYAEYLRACVTPEMLHAYLAEMRSTDVTAELPSVGVPTLVLHRCGIASLGVDLAAGIAAAIPGARLTLLEGDVMRPGVGDVQGVLAAVAGFLGEEPAHTPEIAEDSRAAAFRREGDYWTLVFAGRVARLRDAKGLHHIARLLGAPDRELAAAELIHDNATGAADLGDAGPVLDEQARREYAARLAELRAELEDAESANDLARAQAARAELSTIASEVSAAVGLGGRERRASSAAERARLTVTKRIKDAIERIRNGHPELGRHLAVAIRTGHLCSYRPEPAQKIDWRL
ncbi:MAG TPA: alpha/beta hydrolase [Candidatus Binatia bacterium]|nr:alpha/beta hydrolase [Candidatus Binatia bacterium]